VIRCDRWGEFWAGVRAEVPILFGVLPFGMIYGALAMEAGMSAALSQSLSWIVFAGSAQIVITQLVAYGVPNLVIILTVAVVNLRHVLYSASMAPYLQKLSLAWKLIFSYLLTDEAYAVAITYYERQDLQDKQMDLSAMALERTHEYRHYFLLGAGVALWMTWQLSTSAGLFLGAVIPESWSLDFALPLTFIALVTPLIKDRASVASALVAGIAALVAFNMPYKLGLVAAALVGILVGVVAEKYS